MVKKKSQNERMRERGWITPAEAAELSGCSKQAVYKWLDEGKVECTKSGGRRFVKLESLNVFLGELTKVAT